MSWRYSFSVFNIVESSIVASGNKKPCTISVSGQAKDVPELPGFYYYGRSSVSVLRHEARAEGGRRSESRANSRRIDPAGAFHHSDHPVDQLRLVCDRLFCAKRRRN